MTDDDVVVPPGELTGEEYSRYLLERLKHLEERNALLREQKRRLETQYRTAENDRQRLSREVKHVKAELEKLRSPPLIVGYVKDMLEDGRLVLKSSTGPHFVVHVADFIDRTQLKPGDRVSLNQQSLSVVGILPASLDPAVYGAEVITAPESTYSDVGGMKDQVREIREAVELPMTKPELFEKVGIDPPKGILLHGPPGTGKTLVAKAVAHHTNATFIKLAGSELVQKYIGEGARLVRELFQMARAKAPTILFIDELDAIGASRYEASTSGDREVQRTLMQLLSEMDGFSPRGDVKIIAATNRPDMLDSALLRPGRFDRIIEIPVPDLEARREIFAIHTRRMNMAADVEVARLAVLCGDTATGADIKAACTEAGMFAIREERDMVTMRDFQRAIQKLAGSQIGGRDNAGKDAAFA
ncbi:MAG TPA: proteasome-activating nucleotidase [Candidatus Thermoplasmatota archaeon]|nr:proteasome-activating nucleotidase [Candidatus Thermoplasmatota archaeon]